MWAEWGSVEGPWSEHSPWSHRLCAGPQQLADTSPSPAPVSIIVIVTTLECSAQGRGIMGTVASRGLCGFCVIMSLTQILAPCSLACLSQRPIWDAMNDQCGRHCLGTSRHVQILGCGSSGTASQSPHHTPQHTHSPSARKWVTGSSAVTGPALDRSSHT